MNYDPLLRCNGLSVLGTAWSHSELYTEEQSAATFPSTISSSKQTKTFCSVECWRHSVQTPNFCYLQRLGIITFPINWQYAVITRLEQSSCCKHSSRARLFWTRCWRWKTYLTGTELVLGLAHLMDLVVSESFEFELCHWFHPRLRNFDSIFRQHRSSTPLSLKQMKLSFFQWVVVARRIMLD